MPAAAPRTMPVRLSHPPRRVPFTNCLCLLFGGIMGQFGWLFFGFGMVFVWVFVGSSVVDWAFRLQGEQAAAGRVLRVESTNASEDDVTILAYEIAYVVEGTRYLVRNYGTDESLHAQQAVTVLYPASHPAMGLVSGLRSSEFSAATLFTLLFPAIGLAFGFVQFRSGRRAIRMLRHGLATRGTYEGAEPTGVSVNDVPQMALRYRYEVHGTEYTATAKALANDTRALTDERLPGESAPSEWLLYLPEDPAQAQVLDEHASLTAFGANGELVAASSARAVAVSILPGLAIGGHGAYLLSLFV